MQFTSLWWVLLFGDLHVQAVFTNFASHFKASTLARPGVENLNFRQLTPSEGGSMVKPFSLEEVKIVVWDCDNYKSPGSDEINFGFIKDFWSEMQADIMRFMAEFHCNGRLSKGINSTFIALIPKVDSPHRLNDIRPISLVGSLYKILEKVLANRLRMVVRRVISESQTAFVKDRQILDGILIANEVVDEARKTKKELLLFKVDFEKAYDSVDLGYLDAFMGRMSFPILWRKWIKKCVCTITASVLVNGSPTDEFPMERGLRQGDPLSPFLFLVAAEGLHVTKSWANVRALRAALVLFETMSGLKVNFSKSMLVGVNISDTWLQAAATALRCKIVGVEESLPFFWWSTDSPKVCSDLFACLHAFLLQSSLREIGGLGVRRLKEFNVALLAKWCWRLLVDRGGLWFKVLAAHYGLERGRLRDGGRSGSSWWREIARIRDGVADIGGGWFGETVVRKVGDGVETFFWTDPWLEEIPLCERFRRLFDLTVNKSSTVAECFSLGWGVGGEAWVWRRQLRAWEEELVEECQALLHNFVLQDQSVDMWLWQPDPIRGYSVRGAYQLLISHQPIPMIDTEDLIWHKQVPLKVSIFAWRLLRNKLLTKDNLANRGIITAEAQSCVAGCGALESAQHLFISCSTFGSLWLLVRSWLGVSSADPIDLADHFRQFTLSAGGTRARRSFLQLIWLLCVWTISKERNNRLFRNSEQFISQLMDKVKLNSY
ncbi:hypothetical protein TSUD_374310 [Trifolium subterraneum]|uniref:Reverse transcriptase domain-containing protein n=1 Tax=Trifolium subterraneum TaxID=3900 RepID=A0A2Z6PH19_TRISU|nr:hypothetical protein TSUD_374310 [Trifolium subterraneum]